MRSLLLFLLFTAVCASTVVAQNERIKRLRRAQELYEAKSFLEAAAEYEALMSSASSAAIMGADAKANLAHCYVELSRPEKAEPLYREVMPEMSARPEANLYYGEALMYVGKIEEAKDQFLIYSEKRPDDPRGMAMKDRCTLIENIRPVYPDVSVHPQTIVNRKTTDEFPSAFCGNNLVFSSDRVAKGSVADWTEQKRGYLDLYLSPIDEDGQLGAPKKFPYPINSPSRHDGPATFSRDGKTMYYSQSARSSAGAEALSLQIVVSRYEDGKWTAPEVLPFVEPNHLFSHPCLSPDGLHLYFMSNRPGGLGGTDIWISDYKDNRWMPPHNAGPKINTAQNEGYPYLHASGVLYFASKGHANFGGYDIFRVRPLGNGVDWQDAENLGRPFNSPKDDTYFLLNDMGLSGFVASKRDGDDNIYQFDVVKGDTLRISPDIQPYSAPDFLDLEAVIEDTASVAGNTGGGGSDTDMSDWKLPDNRVNPDEDLVDKMLAGGATADNGTGNNTNNNGTSDNGNSGNNNNNFGNNNGGNNGSTVDNNPTNFSDNFGGNTTKTSGGGSSGNTTPKDNRPAEANPTLTVDLHVVDANINVALKDAKVSLVNLYTKETKDFAVQSDGTVKITLKPDQKYMLRGTCAGYYGSELPIATTNAQHSETKRAYLPLVKKD